MRAWIEISPVSSFCAPRRRGEIQSLGDGRGGRRQPALAELAQGDEREGAHHRRQRSAVARQLDRVLARPARTRIVAAHRADERVEAHRARAVEALADLHRAHEVGACGKGVPRGHRHHASHRRRVNSMSGASPSILWRIFEASASARSIRRVASDTNTDHSRNSAAASGTTPASSSAASFISSWHPRASRAGRRRWPGSTPGRVSRADRGCTTALARPGPARRRAARRR